MNIQQDMGREQMRGAILKQEQIFRQQVHELHRLYHVQKQLMQQQQQSQAAAPSPGPVIVDVKPRPPQLEVWRGGEKATNSRQLISFASCGGAAAAPVAPPAALAEECNLELTLATGVSSSSSNSCGGDAEGRKRRRKASSNSEYSSATAVSSSTSTDSELAAEFRRRREVVADVAVAPAAMFHGESSRTMMMDKMGQGAWMYQCLSLKTA